MDKRVLSEKALYFGKVNMPSGFEINREQLKSDILESRLSGKIRHSKSLDMLNAYIIENTRLKHKISLVNHQISGSTLQPEEKTDSYVGVNLMDLRNSPDFIMIYGVSIQDNSCKILINYDNNRIKSNCHEISLKNNHFVMFPATQTYRIMNESLDYNHLLCITYESI